VEPVKEIFFTISLLQNSFPTFGAASLSAVLLLSKGKPSG